MTAPVVIEQIKYMLMAADMDRGVAFYCDIFGLVRGAARSFRDRRRVRGEPIILADAVDPDGNRFMVTQFVGRA